MLYQLLPDIIYLFPMPLKILSPNFTFTDLSELYRVFSDCLSESDPRNNDHADPSAHWGHDGQLLLRTQYKSNLLEVTKRDTQFTCILYKIKFIVIWLYAFKNQIL